MKKMRGTFINDNGGHLKEVEITIDKGIVICVRNVNETKRSRYIKPNRILGEVFEDYMSVGICTYDLFLFYMDESNDIRYTSLEGMGSLPDRKERKEVFGVPVDIDIVKQMDSL